MTKLLLALLIPAHSLAFTVVSNSSQRGVEALMIGAGQARLGSYGSLSGNTSLLAWTNGKQKFISTNVVTYITSSDDTTSLAPKFVPHLAASVEKWGDYVVSYGLVGDTDRFEVSSHDETQNDFRGMNSSYSGVIGFAKKVNPSLAIGMNLSLDYMTAENSGSGHTDTSLFSFTSHEAVITSQVGVNFSYKFSSWALGGSFKAPFAKYWSEGKQKVKTYDQNLPNVIVIEENTKPSISFSSEARLGAMKKIDSHKLYLDFVYTPSYTDADYEEEANDGYQINFSHEINFMPKINLLYGLSYAEDTYLAMAGLSKSNNHSRTFYGLGHGQDREGSYRMYHLVFGTYFDY